MLDRRRIALKLAHAWCGPRPLCSAISDPPLCWMGSSSRNANLHKRGKRCWAVAWGHALNNSAGSPSGPAALPHFIFCAARSSMSRVGKSSFCQEVGRQAVACCSSAVRKKCMGSISKPPSKVAKCSVHLWLTSSCEVVRLPSNLQSCGSGLRALAGDFRLGISGLRALKSSCGEAFCASAATLAAYSFLSCLVALVSIFAWQGSLLVRTAYVLWRLANHFRLERDHVNPFQLSNQRRKCMCAIMYL